MTPELSAVIEAATDLAWRPTHNIASAAPYRARIESHVRLVEAVQALPHPIVEIVPVDHWPALPFLVRAILRVAECSFSNRMGQPYYERREAVHQLRGCLDVWRREMLERMSA